MELDFPSFSSFTQSMFKSLVSALLAILLLAAPGLADERVAIVRSNGLLVFLPNIDGPGTYGTYLVPNELGRTDIDRFLHHGNPIQINFLPPSELPRNFADFGEKEKLEAFFETEAGHLSKAFNHDVAFTDIKSSSFDGVDYRSGTVSFLDASGRRVEIRITARTAGGGILHAGYQPENPDSISKTRNMVDALLRSFELVRRPLNSEELAKRSKESKK